jgi:WD40 repeat protein
LGLLNVYNRQFIRRQIMKKLQSIALLLVLLALVISACSPAAPLASTEAEVNTVAARDTEVPEAATEAPAATETQEANLRITPDTLGQLRFFWGAEFPGEINTSDNVVGCTADLGPCTKQSNITSYAFSPDGNSLAVGVCEGLITEDRSKDNSDFFACSGESAVILYDSLSGEERGRLITAVLPLSLAYHPDGTLLATGLANSDIEIWDLANEEVSKTLVGTPRFVGIERLAFTPDGNQLLSGFGGGFQLSLWDWRSSDAPTLINRTRAFGISPDGQSLVTTSFGDQAGDLARIRIYELSQLDHFIEIPLDLTQTPPFYFSFDPISGWISTTEADFPVQVNFWDPASQSLAASVESIQEFEQTGMYYDLNSGGFTADGYFMLNRSGELLAAEAQPEATGQDEILWECGFALMDVERNQLFYVNHPMPYEDCSTSPYVYLVFLNEPLILSPDGRFIAGDDGFGALHVWGIDPSMPAVEPACYGDC